MKKLMVLGALAMLPTQAFAVDVVNGGFEAPVVTGDCCITAPPTDIPGWTPTPNVNVVKGTFGSSAGNLAQEGNQYLDLVGQGGTGSISQLLSTIAGQTYSLSFYYSHNLFSGPLTASASVAISDLSAVVTHSTGTNANLDWRLFTGTFTGTGSDTLTFANLAGGSNEGIFLDNISVAAVPEPGTWLMMLIGFGLVGSQMRRRRPVTATAKFA